MAGLSGAKVHQRARLGWLKSTTGSRHERPHAEDRSGAQHDGHGDQLDVSDPAFPGGTQWDCHLQRGELRADCQCAYGNFFELFCTSVHACCPSTHEQSHRTKQSVFQ